jgi:hypothetical protein
LIYTERREVLRDNANRTYGLRLPASFTPTRHAPVAAGEPALDEAGELLLNLLDLA